MDLKSQDFGDTHQEEEHQEQHFHVLAVDDSLIDRKLLERLLTISSYQVTCVDSGNKALEYLGLLEDNKHIESTTSSTSCASCACTSSSSHSSQQEVQGSKVNLIITDYSMPGMSGYDLLKDSRCLEGGAEEFLLKPVQLSDLRKIQSHLSKPLSYSSEDLDMNLVENDENNDNDDDKNNDKNNNNVNKRKAISPECSERRPKMKELAVV